MQTSWPSKRTTTTTTTMVNNLKQFSIQTWFHNQKIHFLESEHKKLIINHWIIQFNKKSNNSD
jgi:hypothetical protein